MDGKTERAFNRAGIDKKKRKGQQNRIVSTPVDADRDNRHLAPLLVDSNQGARMLGISLSHYYKFMRSNKAISPVMVGTLHMWRKKDLLRFTGKSCDPLPATDILIDAQDVATLCAISRSMVYKLNDQSMMPKPIMDGRTLRWSVQAIEEWIDAGCPKRPAGKFLRHKKSSTI